MPKMVQGSCGHQIAVEDSFAGTSAMCGFCNQMVAVGGAPGYPQQAYGQPMGGGYGYGGAPAYYAGGSSPPPRGMAIAGGVISILVSALFLLGGIVAIIAGGSARGGMFGGVGDAVMIIGVIITIVGLTALLAGAFACASKPGWTLTSAIFQTLFALLNLLAGFQRHGGPNLLFGLLCLLAAIFCYVGFGQAKRYQQWKMSGGAA